MHIRARVENRRGSHQVTLTTNGQGQSLTIPPRATGFGSSANGGEFLALALATCFCNDLYREAATRRITVHSVEVEVDAEFGASSWRRPTASPRFTTPCGLASPSRLER